MNHMNQRFTLDLTPEEGVLLLTGARLLDKLVAGISIQSQEKDELIKDVIIKLSQNIPANMAGLSEEIADVILESIFSLDEASEEELNDVSVCVAMDQLDTDSPCSFPMYPIDKTLPVLQLSLQEHFSVRVNYYSFARESVDRLTLNPLTLFVEEDLWKMIAYCQEKDEVMVFRVDRIKDIAETSVYFTVPETCKPRHHLPFAS